MAEKNFLRQEIHQQPAVLQNLLAREMDTMGALADEIRAQNITQLVIAGRGTSDNAARYAQYLLGGRNRMLVSLATPSLFTIYHQPPRLAGTMVLAISQSGKSPDIVAVVEEAHRQGALTAAITNQPASDLARSSRFVVDLGAGEERSVAATKTYTAELGAIALLSACLCGESSMWSALQEIPAAMLATLRMETQVFQAAQRYRYMRECVVIGRGYNYATAYELALKLKELTYTFVEPYSSADFMHGPLAIIEHGFPAIVIAPSGEMLPELMKFMKTLKERRAEIITISDDAQALLAGDIPFTLPCHVPEWLSPLLTILPGQIFSLALAEMRGYDVDRPRGLNKITETH
jgi:glutamine---fructose-6-phosphate transaminase (isomerizing)